MAVGGGAPAQPWGGAARARGGALSLSLSDTAVCVWVCGRGTVCARGRRHTVTDYPTVRLYLRCAAEGPRFRCITPQARLPRASAPRRRAGHIHRPRFRTPSVPRGRAHRGSGVCGKRTHESDAVCVYVRSAAARATATVRRAGCAAYESHVLSLRWHLVYLDPLRELVLGLNGGEFGQHLHANTLCGVFDRATHSLVS